MATWLVCLVYGVGYCCAVVPTAWLYYEPDTRGLFSTPRAAFVGGIMGAVWWPIVLVGWLIWKMAGLFARSGLLDRKGSA